MANNLFISYDLKAPNKDYSAVIAEIKSLGNWAALQKSLWYVNSNLSAQDAAKRIWAKMDQNDSLIVINASSKDAYWFNFSNEVSQHIQKHWNN